MVYSLIKNSTSSSRYKIDSYRLDPQSLLVSAVSIANTYFSLFSSSRVIDFYRKQRDALMAAADKWLNGEWNAHPVLG